jgi:hypothetical protein
MLKPSNSAVTLITLFLVACGGGGGSSDSPAPPPAPPANNAPVFSGDTIINVAENSSAGISLMVTDSDGDTVSISALGGADAALFNSSALTLSFKSSPDFEAPGDADGNNRYEIEVTVSDGKDGEAARAYTINVTDIDDRSCQEVVQQELATCSAAVHSALSNCYDSNSEACVSTDSALTNPLQAMQLAVSQRCTDPAAAGFNVNLTGLNTQLQESCLGRSETLIARSYGGPQAANYEQALAASGTDQACLETANAQGHAFASQVVSDYQACIDGNSCGTINTTLQPALSAAVNSINQACSSNDLQALTGLSAATLLQRSREEAECQVALANPQAANLDLACAPKRAVRAVQAWEYPSGSPNQLFASNTSNGSPSSVTQHEPQRGQYVQIELDATETGAMCGNGSNYRFWLQLAPQGHDLSKIVVYMQGGGACTIHDCEPQILSAIDIANGGTGGSDRLLNTRHDDVGQKGGILFGDMLEADNPYKNWTKISLLYCNQDIYAGGANGSQDFTVNVPGQGNTNYTIQRKGGHNARTALAYARNAIWAAMQAENTAYDPDAVEATLVGSSAGGFGTMFHYHYLLDELRWRDTAAVNLWGQGLDDKSTNGANLRNLVSILTPPWDLLNVFPPYCTDPACIHVEEQVTRTMPRLDTARYPRQHYGNVTGQIDITQAVTTGYGNSSAGLKAWGDAMRDTYCRMRDANNIPSQDNQFVFLPLISAHGFNPNTVYAPNNIGLFNWMADWEQDFSVADNVNASGNNIVADGNTITLKAFNCSP